MTGVQVSYAKKSCETDQMAVRLLAALKLYNQEGPLHRIARARDAARIEHGDASRRDLGHMRMTVNGDVTA